MPHVPSCIIAGCQRCCSRQQSSPAEPEEVQQLGSWWPAVAQEHQQHLVTRLRWRQASGVNPDQCQSHWEGGWQSKPTKCGSVSSSRW